MSTTKYYIYALIAALITGGSGYLFSKARGGVHFENISLLIICIASIIAVIVFLSKAKGKSFEPLAKKLGLKVSGSLNMGSGSHVDMEGEIQNRAVFLRYQDETSHSTMGGYSNHSCYKFTLKLTNPYKIDLYVGPEGLLNTPANILTLPEKLDTSNWEWADFIPFFGPPGQAVIAIF